MENKKCDKMIIAILQNDDYHDVITDLNEHGFYVTVLQSSGGFLKRPSATIMIGLNHEEVDKAVDLLKNYGHRSEMEYMPATSTAGMGIPPLTTAAVPLKVQCGGIVLFILDVDQYHRF